MIGIVVAAIIIPVVLMMYEEELKEWGRKMKEKLKK
jgi:hypothetical protein